MPSSFHGQGPQFRAGDRVVNGGTEIVCRWVEDASPSTTIGCHVTIGFERGASIWRNPVRSALCYTCQQFGAVQSRAFGTRPIARLAGVWTGIVVCIVVCIVVRIVVCIVVCDRPCIDGELLVLRYDSPSRRPRRMLRKRRGARGPPGEHGRGCVVQAQHATWAFIAPRATGIEHISIAIEQLLPTPRHRSLHSPLCFPKVGKWCFVTQSDGMWNMASPVAPHLMSLHMPSSFHG